MVESWSKITEPAIPSKNEIQFIREYISNNYLAQHEFKVLILGSTPRLRDLLSEFVNCKVFLCDINPEMTFAMTELLEKANPENETWVKTSWLDMPFKDQNFDLILGDITIDNVPFELHNQYIDEVRRVLKDTGTYLGRFIFFRDHHDVIDFEKTLESYGELTPAKLSPLWSIGTFFRTPAQTKEVMVADFVKFIEETKSNFIKQTTLITGIEEYYPFNKSWYTYHIDDFEQLIQDKFRIENKFVADDNNMIPGYEVFLEILELKKV